MQSFGVYNIFESMFFYLKLSQINFKLGLSSKQKIRISSTRDVMQILGKTFLGNDLLHITTCVLLMSLSSEKKLEGFQNTFMKNIFLKKKIFCKNVEICKRSRSLKCSNLADFLSPSQKHIGYGKPEQNCFQIALYNCYSHFGKDINARCLFKYKCFTVLFGPMKNIYL